MMPGTDGRRSEDGQQHIRRSASVWAGRILLVFAVLMILSFFGFLITLRVAPDGIMRVSREHVGAPYPYEEKISSCETFPDGRVLWKDLDYGSEYPNDYLDIMLPAKILEDTVTIMNIHGGGAVSETKEDAAEYLAEFVQEGCIVVTVDYAYLPEYRYPVQLYQAAAAFSYLAECGDAYGISGDRIVLMGDSTGGMLAGQLALVQTDDAYAQAVSLEAVCDAEGEPISPLGVILNCPLLDMRRYDHTGNFWKNRFYEALGHTYFDAADWKESPEAILCSVLYQVGEDYPPCFITDGNTGSFTDQAYEFVEKLEAERCICIANFPDESKVPHDYHKHLDRSDARENLAMQLEFLKMLQDGFPEIAQ